jgi:hypothetical protein
LVKPLGDRANGLSLIHRLLEPPKVKKGRVGVEQARLDGLGGADSSGSSLTLGARG